MKTIDINKRFGCEITKFPDGQLHTNICENNNMDFQKDDEIRVVARIRNAQELYNLLSVANAIDNIGAHKSILCIPYLMGARYDRVMIEGDAVDIEVVASAINSCKFKKVVLFDVHSPVSTDLIENSINCSNIDLLREYKKENYILICPDKGARSKIQSILHVLGGTVNVVRCEKSRDKLGRITLEVEEPEICKDQNCVIVDDLCDGGGTFMAIAEQIQPKHLCLIVSHGIFSRGFNDLRKQFNQIITTNSFKEMPKYDWLIQKELSIWE